ncbi:MAG TPA: PA0069 family radical SAM protein, partial [Bacteroidota bacterium]|nr:PA0069 family radical SAM protein [Bacteroidota bacterium]
MKGRGIHENPRIRFEKLSREPLIDDLSPDDVRRSVPTQFYRDNAKTILAKNDSPDVGFTFDLNPYRGCEHGCSYCYARPTHEYLGFSSGLDFETKIVVKENAAKLLEAEFRRKSWSPEVVMLSGNVDCYQPIERKLGITRDCLEVFLRYRNPVSVITKNELVLRDLDILSKLAALNLVSVCLSITTLDNDLARRMEPRTSAPERRLFAIEQLAKEGIPVSVNVAPVIPGLNDEEIPAILCESAARGAKGAGFILVRLPFAVKDIFVEWLKREFPTKADRVVHRIQEIRNGKLNDSNFATRMRGSGEIADSIRQLFHAGCRKYGLSSRWLPLSTDKFIRPDVNRLQEQLSFG